MIGLLGRRGELRAALGVGLSVVCLGQAAQAGQLRPNVIVMMTDDQTVESLRVMPSVKRLLADAGVVFDASFASYPLCCPSRATLNTGQYAHNHQVLGNRPPNGGYARLDTSNTLAVWLERAGYRTVHIGKFLNGYGRDVPADVPPGWTEWYAAVDGSTYRMWGYTLNRNGTLVTYGTAEEEDPALYQTDVYRDLAVDVVERLAPSDTPFYLDVAFLAPHAESSRGSARRFVRSAPRHRGTMSEEILPRPPSFDEIDVGDKPAFLRALPPLTRRDERRIEARYRARLESLLAVDEAVAAIVGALDAAGELDRTLVIFTSDNGFFHGEHRVANGKFLVYEPSIRVPLIVRGPGIPAGRRSQELVVNADLAPTILDVAGATPERILDGRSLFPFASDPERRSRRPILLETGIDPGDDLDQDDEPTAEAGEDPAAQGGATAYTAVRTRRFLYAEYGSGERELYDLKEDPHQLESRHGDLRYARTRSVLARVLESLRACSGDSCRAETFAPTTLGARPTENASIGAH